MISSDPAADTAPRGPLRRLARGAATVALVGALAVALMTLAPALLGYERYAITSGSMTGSYDRGSVVYAKAIATDSLAVGDVITYSPPPGKGPDHLVTHRIASIGHDRHGERIFQTKGDANEHRDPWHFRLDHPTQARASFAIPYLGYAIAALSIRQVRMLLIGLPALLIALALLTRLWRDAGEELRRRENGAQAKVGAS